MTIQYSSEINTVSIKAGKPTGRPKYDPRDVNSTVVAAIRWAAHYGQACYVVPTAYGWQLCNSENKIPCTIQRFIVTTTAHDSGTYAATVEFKSPVIGGQA